MKKIIITISIILGILAMGLGIYFAWKKSKAILTPPAISEQGKTPSGQTTGGQATGGQMTVPKLKILSDQPIFDYWTHSTSTGQIEIFYLNQKGQVFKVKEGEDEAITSEPIENLQSIKVTADGKQLLTKFGSFDSPSFIIFNSETKIQQLLPETATAFAFSPDGQKIAYLQTNSDKSDLIIKSLADSKQKASKIISLSQKDFDLEWTLPGKIILVPRPSAFYQGMAWSVDVKNKTLSALTPETYGLIIKWSADGKLGLKFSSGSQGQGGSLSLINEQGQTRANLSFLTLPNKCLVSEPKIYCAIPREIPPKTALPDDYLKRAVYFSDYIYQIDTVQNSLTEIFVANEPVIDASHLTLADNKLLFVNKYDGKLYSLEL